MANDFASRLGFAPPRPIGLSTILGDVMSQIKPRIGGEPKPPPPLEGTVAPKKLKTISDADIPFMLKLKKKKGQSLLGNITLPALLQQPRQANITPPLLGG